VCVPIGLIHLRIARAETLLRVMTAANGKYSEEANAMYVANFYLIVIVGELP